MADCCHELVNENALKVWSVSFIADASKWKTLQEAILNYYFWSQVWVGDNTRKHNNLEQFEIATSGTMTVVKSFLWLLCDRLGGWGVQHWWHQFFFLNNLTTIVAQSQKAVSRKISFCLFSNMDKAAHQTFMNTINKSFFNTLFNLI